MLAHLGQWLRAVLVVAVLGNLAEWLLPAGAFKRYSGLVVGLVLLAAILGPFQRWMQGWSGLPAVAWSGATGGNAYQALLRAEEEKTVAAMVRDFPGVEAVRVTVEAGAVVVTVRARRPLGSGFRAYVEGAAAAAAPGLAVKLRVTTTPAGGRP
jgi:hypothetical protein